VFSGEGTMNERKQQRGGLDERDYSDFFLSSGLVCLWGAKFFKSWKPKLEVWNGGVVMAVPVVSSLN
jgi:hypothetical protein